MPLPPFGRLAMAGIKPDRPNPTLQVGVWTIGFLRKMSGGFPPTSPENQWRAALWTLKQVQGG